MNKRTWSNVLFHWLPYIFIALGLGWGLWAVDQGQEQRQQDLAAEAHANCLTLKAAIESNKDTLSALISAQTAPQPIPIPEGASPALIETINGVNARAVINSQRNRDALLSLIEDSPSPKCNST